MSAETYEIHIELIPLLIDMPPDELHRWGLVKFREMTRAEFEEKYGQNGVQSPPL